MRFYTLYEQKFSNLRPLPFITFPQGFWKSKSFGLWILGTGRKKMFKQSEQMKKIRKKPLVRFAHGFFFLHDHFRILQAETAICKTRFPSPVLSKLHFLFCSQVLFMHLIMWKTPSNAVQKQWIKQRILLKIVVKIWKSLVNFFKFDY